MGWKRLLIGQVKERLLFRPYLIPIYYLALAQKGKTKHPSKRRAQRATFDHHQIMHLHSSSLLQGRRRWLGRAGNYLPRFWQISTSIRGGRLCPPPNKHYCLPTQILVASYAPASFLLQTSSSHEFHLIDILRQVRDIPYGKNELQWTWTWLLGLLV